MEVKMLTLIFRVAMPVGLQLKPEGQTSQEAAILKEPYLSLPADGTVHRLIIIISQTYTSFIQEILQYDTNYTK
jgi:hypothetical protein